ncbi:formate dehydrogenase accessory protein FdhE [Crenobacter sp. SG2305]|uniref:formate dehydrogenase accessory protein FdhE n=1 Tax=Crenobacter oryzisoli TaxID=3056844 RepID=UPI0025AB0D48|nr:formate dehydrogenase accessory protein FdhE [Crenobacter sp. SG2305]MDN0082328.1 formate dehydrogenase accessory protein FdhE [Crenobacter sp. SG2305]
MTIRIVPEAEIRYSSDRIAPLRLPDPRRLYRERADRLATLAEGHAMAEYLRFVRRLVELQCVLVNERPVVLPDVAGLLATCAEHGLPPLSVDGWQRQPVWQILLDVLLSRLVDDRGLPSAVHTAAQRLAATPAGERERQADALLAGDPSPVGIAAAPLMWSALSAYWSQLAAQLVNSSAVATPDGQHSLCPVCGSAPVASVVRIGDAAGLRYLHCSLCESEWHRVRSQCSHCDASHDIGYWVLNADDAPIRAESCGDCHSYLKLIRQDKDPAADPVADDLATLALDILVEERGFARSGANPFLFVG